MFNRVLLLSLPLIGQAQFISMVVCSDNSCSKDCIYWDTESGKCVPCNKAKGACSAANPSSVTTADSITFYSDNTCAVSNVIQGFPISLNSNCNKLVSSNTVFGSYRASNLSLAIGLTAILLILFLIGCLFCCWKQKTCCFYKPGTDLYQSTNQQDPNPVPIQYNTTTITPYSSSYGYPSNITVSYPATNPNSVPNPYAPPNPVNPYAAPYVAAPYVAAPYPAQDQAVYPSHGYGYPNSTNQTVYYKDQTQPKVV